MTSYYNLFVYDKIETFSYILLKIVKKYSILIKNNKNIFVM